METKEHSKQVREETVDKFGAVMQLDYKTISQDLNISWNKVQSKI